MFFFGTAQPLLWLFHLLGDSLSFGLSLSAAGPDGALRKPGAQIDRSMRTRVQTQLPTAFARQLECKQKRNSEVECIWTHLSPKSNLSTAFSIFSLLQEVWGECCPSLISPQPMSPPPPCLIHDRLNNVIWCISKWQRTNLISQRWQEGRIRRDSDNNNDNNLAPPSSGWKREHCGSGKR